MVAAAAARAAFTLSKAGSSGVKQSKRHLLYLQGAECAVVSEVCGKIDGS